MSDHANNAAAVAAGWVREQVDRGAGRSPRYITRYSKPTIGAPGQAGGLLSNEVTSDVSQAQADTDALTALNQIRKHVYGGAGATAASGRTFDA